MTLQPRSERRVSLPRAHGEASTSGSSVSAPSFIQLMTTSASAEELCVAALQLLDDVTCLITATIIDDDDLTARGEVWQRFEAIRHHARDIHVTMKHRDNNQERVSRCRRCTIRSGASTLDDLTPP